MSKDFQELVLKHFKEVISEFKFEFRPIRYDEIQLVGDKCIVRFIYDNGYVYCDFIDPEVKIARENLTRKDGMPAGFPVYPIYSIWEFLYPNDRGIYSINEMDMEKQISTSQRLLVERLSNVLNGDFSWVNDYVISNNRLSEKIEYMMTYWDLENPVRVSFRSGDRNWEKKFDEYKKYLDDLSNG